MKKRIEKKREDKIGNQEAETKYERKGRGRGSQNKSDNPLFPTLLVPVRGEGRKVKRQQGPRRTGSPSPRKTPFRMCLDNWIIRKIREWLGWLPDFLGDLHVKAKGRCVAHTNWGFAAGSVVRV